MLCINCCLTSSKQHFNYIHGENYQKTNKWYIGKCRVLGGSTGGYFDFQSQMDKKKKIWFLFRVNYFLVLGKTAFLWKLDCLLDESLCLWMTINHLSIINCLLPGVPQTTLCDKVCQWLAIYRWFSWALRFPPSIKLTATI